MPCNMLIAYVRATTSVRANFLSILQGKTYFFYFTYSLLQNTHISLSILHIYSIKYSFFLHFLLFASLSSLELSHKHNTNPKSPTPSHRLLRWATNPTQTQNHPHPATSHHQRSNRTKSPSQLPSSRRETQSSIAGSRHESSPWIPTPSRPRISTRIDAEQNHPHPTTDCSRSINSLSPTSTFLTHSPPKLNRWRARSPPSYRRLRLRSLRFWKRRRSWSALQSWDERKRELWWNEKERVEMRVRRRREKKLLK